MPIPKKGDLSVCDNWRGISLLDVMGKLFVRIFNNSKLWLRTLLLIHSVALGLMVFCVRQIVEKTIEHHSKVFLLFHDGMAATVLVGVEDATLFEVRNGLPQGCTIAPLCLFEQVFQCLLFRCNAMEVRVLYKIGGKLIGECTRRPSSFVISEWLFADDKALICTSRSDMDNLLLLECTYFRKLLQNLA